MYLNVYRSVAPFFLFKENKIRLLHKTGDSSNVYKNEFFHLKVQKKEAASFLAFIHANHMVAIMNIQQIRIFDARV